MAPQVKLGKVTLQRWVVLLTFTLLFPLSSFLIPLSTGAAQLSYPACEESIKTELEAKLKEKISEVQSVIECLKTEDGYFLRIKETSLQSPNGNVYEFQSVAEANALRDAITITRRTNRETLQTILGIIETSAIHNEMIASIPNPARSLALAGGLIIQIEARGATKPNLYFAGAGTSSLRPIKETTVGIDSSLAPLSIASVGLQFSPLTLTNFNWSPVPPIPPPTPQTGSRISNPAFALCNPSTLQAVAYGERNNAVQNLQHCLLGLGYSIPAGATGFYGNQTVAALKLFYKDHANLTWHGLKFGPLGIQTLQRLAMTAR